MKSTVQKKWVSMLINLLHLNFAHVKDMTDPDQFAHQGRAILQHLYFKGVLLSVLKLIFPGDVLCASKNDQLLSCWESNPTYYVLQIGVLIVFLNRISEVSNLSRKESWKINHHYCFFSHLLLTNLSPQCIDLCGVRIACKFCGKVQKQCIGIHLFQSLSSRMSFNLL